MSTDGRSSSNPFLRREFLPDVEDCPTATAVANVIDGAAERAVLIDVTPPAEDASKIDECGRGNKFGRILHMNQAAVNFLWVNLEDPNITDFLFLGDDGHDIGKNQEKDWTSITSCRIMQINQQKDDGEAGVGKFPGKKPTRNARNLTWSSIDCLAKVGAAKSSEAEEGTTGMVPRKLLVCYVCSKHERVREVMDHAFDPVVTTDPNGVIRTANKAAYDLFQYDQSVTELTGQNVSILCGAGHSPKHQRYIQKYHELKKESKKAEQKTTQSSPPSFKTHVVGTRREVTGRRKDGSEFPCEIGVQEFNDVSTGLKFFCGYFKDLTLQHQHEAQMLEKQALLQGMINASFDSMFEIDESGIIKVVNDSACAMLGYTREEFIGSNISMICGGGEAPKHDMYMKRYLDTDVKHIIGRKRQVKCRRKDGSEFDVELGVQEVLLAESSGGKKSFCGFIRDLTQQQKDKRALRKQQQLIHNKFFGTEEEK
mmetsp:Transcript_58997/g.144355  ORF Transcript_58997/g.144355 Transcript_58997/m.144355 type:complete len:483 (+) Transcript_58997:107-1555(+)